MEKIRTDVLVIGGGGAGVRAALAAAEAGTQVLLLSRSPLGKGGLTPTANGGYHAACVPGDSPELHAAELIRLGRGLNDRNLVHTLTQNALNEAKRLGEFGARITWEVPPKPHEPEMTYPRSLFIPGREMMSALRKGLKRTNRVTLREYCLTLGLLTVDGAVQGAMFLDILRGILYLCESKVTILATGSLGELFSINAQEPMGIPTGSTGSGYVLALEAGADLIDMEMIQFAPVPVQPSLIWGLRFLPWPHLKNGKGEEFLPSGVGEYSHEAARAILREIKEGRGPISMDLRHKEPPAKFRHPLAEKRYRKLQEFSVTPYQRRIILELGALFAMGGIHINERGETTVNRLYAAGEVAGNVHGARRVSGNALPEIIVFGARAGHFAALRAKEEKSYPGVSPGETEGLRNFFMERIGKEAKGADPREIRAELRKIASEFLSVIRSQEGLEKAKERITNLKKEWNASKVAVKSLALCLPLMEAFDVYWLLETAEMVCQAALMREESRGFHFREDFPQERDEWLKHTVVRKKGDELWVSAKPVVL